MTAAAATNLRAVDVDVHHQIGDWGAVAPYVPAGLRWRVGPRGGPPMAQHGFKSIGATRSRTGRRSGQSSRSSISIPRGVDVAILTGSLLSLGVQPNPDLAAAVARGVNDWTLDTWVRPFDCYKGSILIAQQDPLQAVAEIDRLGDDPGMVQVLMGSASEAPFGRRAYHPIYDACVRHDLPLALHIGGEGAGISSPATAVGHPTTYFEWYGSLPQSYMAHIMSMVTEGVFERFPDAQGRPVRRRRVLAAACHVALRQELEGAALGDAVGQAGAQPLYPRPLLFDDVSARSGARSEVPARAARNDRGASARSCFRAVIRTGRWAIRSR